MKIIISNSSDKPIYEQITEQIKNQIIDGTLKSEDLLPSIRALAKDIRVSVITTKRAYEDLEKDGFIQTIPGKGTYVANKNKQLIREEQLKIVEDLLQKVVETAQRSNIEVEEIYEILELLYGNDKR